MTAAEFDFAMLMLRVVIGPTVFAHGFFKAFRGGRLAGTGRWFDSIGMKPGAMHARLAATTEMAAGAGLAIGLFTPLCAAAVVGLMVVAGWTVHRANGFFIVKEGWEYVFVLAVVSVAIAMLGPGRWSADNVIGDLDTSWNGWLGLVTAAGVGLTAGIGLLAVFFRPPPTESST